MLTTSPTATPTAERTPTTLIAVSASIGTAIASARGTPAAVEGHTYPIACAKPTDSDATEETRASQVIQPTSKPTNSPNAVRA